VAHNPSQPRGARVRERAAHEMAQPVLNPREASNVTSTSSRGTEPLHPWSTSSVPAGLEHSAALRGTRRNPKTDTAALWQRGTRDISVSLEHSCPHAVQPCGWAHRVVRISGTSRFPLRHRALRVWCNAVDQAEVHGVGWEGREGGRDGASARTFVFAFQGFSSSFRPLAASRSPLKMVQRLTYRRRCVCHRAVTPLSAHAAPFLQLSPRKPYGAATPRSTNRVRARLHGAVVGRVATPLLETRWG
jgi:hypothetical protein